MDEESTSWIRRTKFSHTVYHRIDPSKLASIPIRFRTQEIPNFDSHTKSEPNTPQVQQTCLTNKSRSVSPLPEIRLPDTFKEARSESKRFLTPRQRREGSGPVDKPSGKSKMKKDSSWSKFFDHAGGKVRAVEAVDEHMLDLTKLIISSKFASGANSQLYRAEYKGKAAAVKLMCVLKNDETGLLASRLENQFTREVTLLTRLHHPNVIKFMAARKEPPVYCIVTEYMPEGSLRASLHKREHEPLPLRKVIPFALEIARGMEYVHSQGVIHRDLKPENILIDQDFHIKIADFGIACEEVRCDRLADDPGTYRWMAPELIRHKRYGRKVDVYSFGLILWEMVSGSIPYEDMVPLVAAYAVVSKVRLFICLLFFYTHPFLSVNPTWLFM
ncbi:hypothetical protein RND81_10G040500 [Saponaria officinalis]|uniref:Protein kinase domain-containing protein n=1 Tax=Saponaria officinalis TaxID=3572 RepID=A0AAW1I0G3_SAPOF